jgi:hypothetical protein
MLLAPLFWSLSEKATDEPITIAAIDISTTPSLIFIKSSPFDIYVRTLARRDTFAFTLNRALGKINGFTASAAGVGPIKFIRKYFFFLAAFGTFAGDYLEIFKICIAGTMLRRGNIIRHDILLIVNSLRLQLDLRVTLCALISFYPSIFLAIARP